VGCLAVVGDGLSGEPGGSGSRSEELIELLEKTEKEVKEAAAKAQDGRQRQEGASATMPKGRFFRMSFWIREASVSKK